LKAKEERLSGREKKFTPQGLKRSNSKGRAKGKDVHD